MKPIPTENQKDLFEQGLNGLRADDIQVSGNHYKDMAVQPWAVMEAVLTTEEFRGFLRGNVIKYAMRQGKKQDSDDAGKAKHYIQKLKEFNETLQQMRGDKA
jgi:hypothetical protein